VIIINLNKKKKPKPKSNIKLAIVAKPKAEIKKPDAAPMLHELEIDYARILKERHMLSSYTARLVERTIEDMKKESPALLTEFMEGRLPVPALKQHYAKIQDKSDQLLALYDKMEHLKRYGTMPVMKAPAESIIKIMDSPEAAQVRYEIRRLDDYIYKRLKKIEDWKKGLRKPVNTQAINDTKVEIQLAEARRDDCKVKLKRLQYEQRTGGV
jgi:hypothetical protein